MTALNDDQIQALLAVAAGDVSYLSQYSRTTAAIVNGRWISKRFAYDVLKEMIEAERKAAYVAPALPTVKGKRTLPYAGPFPRGKHSHKCASCEERGQYNAVACYKSKCTKPQLTATCSWCAQHYAMAR